MQHCHVATMVSEVVKVGYLMQGGILIVHNFVNTHERWLSCIYLLSVHHSESTKCSLALFSVQLLLKSDPLTYLDKITQAENRWKRSPKKNHNYSQR